MIEFPRDPQNTIPTSSVKIIGLGGAGANMLDRVALDGIEGAELLALNTDIRTLSGSVAGEKIQLGRNLTKGLGTGGDPDLGLQAVQEAEDEIRASLKGRKIVFICVGLGGGTGSGASPIVARVAREEGAFVVMFATMPFVFEGRRRREQAETSLNELAVLSNALVTFDNSRMGELVLAKQGIHEAFAAADRMISESIKAVIRLVVRPGLINIGLDDLMSALRTTRSRCLFGSGLARGKDRAQKALRNALASPLLDEGALLKDAETVLVHLCGGEDLTLFEIELLMESLGKYVPDKAHVLFGAAVDPGMNDQLSITMVSSLPEERLRQPSASAGPGAALSVSSALEPSTGFAAEAKAPRKPAVRQEEPEPEPEPEAIADEPEPEAEAVAEEPEPEPEWEADEVRAAEPEAEEPEPEEELEEEPEEKQPEVASAKAAGEMLAELDEDFAEPPATDEDTEPEAESEAEVEAEDEADGDDRPEKEGDAPFAESGFSFKPAGKSLPKGGRRAASSGRRRDLEAFDDSPFADGLEEPADVPKAESPKKAAVQEPLPEASSEADEDSQGELSFEGGPRGRFEGAQPSMFDGEDLDVPAFLRKKRR